MQLDLSKATVPVTWVGIIALATWEAYRYLDDRHAHSDDMVVVEAKIVERDLMSQSTRYAEIAKFYTDKMQAGEPLTKAEQERLDLVQRQQQRIATALKGDE